MSGVRTAAEIVNLMGRTQDAVLESVRGHDPELAQKIMDNMFVFEDLLEIEDRGIQLILREMQSESLIVALKGASTELRDKIFNNMSQRAAEMLREDLENKGPVKLSEVEFEQKEILKIVRRMADEGLVSIGSRGDEAYI
jgi:flagellar motor switch protein FliG